MLFYWDFSNISKEGNETNFWSARILKRRKTNGRMGNKRPFNMSFYTLITFSYIYFPNYSCKTRNYIYNIDTLSNNIDTLAYNWIVSRIRNDLNCLFYVCIDLTVCKLSVSTYMASIIFVNSVSTTIDWKTFCIKCVFGK